jgi:hypothetical protein
MNVCVFSISSVTVPAAWAYQSDLWDRAGLAGAADKANPMSLLALPSEPGDYTRPPMEEVPPVPVWSVSPAAVAPLVAVRPRAPSSCPP